MRIILQLILLFIAFSSFGQAIVDIPTRSLKSVRDFGIVGDGVSISQTKLDTLSAFLDDSLAQTKIYWPGGEYLFPDTFSLTNKRGFHFVGDGSSSVQPKTRLRVNGSGAGHRGVLSLTSCTDFSFRGIEFVVGGSGADQAVELKADDIPSLSCLEGIFEHCQFRRFTGIAEFTYAALYIRNSAMITLHHCTFPTAVKSLRLGNQYGIETGTYGDGHVAQITLSQCWFFGDVERVYCSGVIYEDCFFDIKTGSDSQPSVMTTVAPERIRNETLLNNFCQPAATNKTRTFYIQGTNSLSGGLTAIGNRVAEVAIGFDLISGFADIKNNLSLQTDVADKFVNIRAGATKVTVWNNDVASLTAAGGVEISDATSGVYKQSPFGAIAPTTTQGDLIIRGASVNERLAVGPFGGILGANGTSPIWAMPTNLVVLFDEHLQSVTIGGALNLGNINSGTVATMTAATGSGTTPGIVQLQTGTDTTGRSTYRNGLAAMRFGSGRVIFSSRLRVPTLSDGTETFTVWVGFVDNGAITGDTTDGAYFIYSSASTYYTNIANWSGKTSNNSSRTEVSSATAVTANQFYTILIDVNAAGTQADFYLDGVLIGSSTTNIPTGSGREFGFGYKIEKSAGTTSRNLDIDYSWFAYQFSSSRFP